jgi:hypothetical protein
MFLWKHLHVLLYHKLSTRKPGTNLFLQILLKVMFALVDKKVIYLKSSKNWDFL